MSRKDPTFTEADLIRFYCSNLDVAEQTRVLDRFSTHILHRKALCECDEDKTDWCAWASALNIATTIASTISDHFAEIIAGLTAAIAFLGRLTWTGILGRFIAALIAVLTTTLAFIAYIGGIMLFIGKMDIFAVFLTDMLCSERDFNPDSFDGTPPDVAEIPENPLDVALDYFQKQIEDLIEWFNPFSLNDDPLDEYPV
jgi:hypothetical protein